MAAPSEDFALSPRMEPGRGCLGQLQHPALPPGSLQLLCQLPSKVGTLFYDSLLPQPLAPMPAPLELCHPGWLQPWTSPRRELIPTTPIPWVWKLAAHPVGPCGVNPHIQGICCRSGYKMENTGIMCRNGRSLMGLSWQVVCSKRSRCLGCPVPGTPRLGLDGWNSCGVGCTALKG